MRTTRSQPKCIKKANTIIQEARWCYQTFYMPFLGLIFVYRLVQWKGVEKELRSINAPRSLMKQFEVARKRLWIAILLWPAILLIMLIVLGITLLTL